MSSFPTPATAGWGSFLYATYFIFGGVMYLCRLLRPNPERFTGGKFGTTEIDSLVIDLLECSNDQRFHPKRLENMKLVVDMLADRPAYA